jgi:hypothetical protein
MLDLLQASQPPARIDVSHQALVLSAPDSGDCEDSNADLLRCGLVRGILVAGLYLSQLLDLRTFLWLDLDLNLVPTKQILRNL